MYVLRSIFILTKCRVKNFACSVIFLMCHDRIYLIFENDNHAKALAVLPNISHKWKSTLMHFNDNGKSKLQLLILKYRRVLSFKASFL